MRAGIEERYAESSDTIRTIEKAEFAAYDEIVEACAAIKPSL
jgi:hypothetical protein